MKYLIGICAAVSLLLLSACGTLNPAGAYGKDKALYDADLAIGTTYNVVDSFLKFEVANRASLASQPAITKAADDIRRTAPGAINAAIAARDAYAASPSTGNQQQLTAALSALHPLILEAAKLLSTQPTK